MRIEASTDQTETSLPVTTASSSSSSNDNIDTMTSQSSQPPTASALKYVPYCCRYSTGPLEATGLSIDFYARAVVLMSSIFMGPALLELATEAAGCPNEQDCNARIWLFMKPSSLLSNIAIVTGITVSLGMPLIGAMVDYTNQRRRVGAYTAYLLAVSKGIEACVSQRTWVLVAAMQIVSGVVYFCHTTAGYAYNAELSNDSVQQTKYNTYYFFVLYMSTLFFLAQVLVVSTLLDTGDVGTARISQIITSVTSAIAFGWAWTCFFSDRPAARPLPDNTTLLSAGFRKTTRTFWSVRTRLPYLWWLMCSVAVTESATAALITIATTYMAHFLDMDSSQIGVVFIVVLLTGVPGSRVGHILGVWYNPLRSAQVCILYFIVVTVIAAFVLTDPSRSDYTVLFGAFWGIGLGWLHPMNSTMFMTMSPAHSRTEYMGLYIFCGQVLSWMPPLVFTAVNEANVSMSIGLASLNVFFLVGFFCLVMIGRYDNAVAAVSQTSSIRTDDHVYVSGSDVATVELPSLA